MGELKELGVNGYEEKVYTALLQNGPSHPKRISEKSGVPPTAVYPAVQALVEKGMALRFDTTSQQYEAIPAKTAFKKLVHARMQRIKNTETELITQFESLDQQECIPPAPILLSRGTGASIEQSDALSAFAKKTFYVLGWNFRKLKSVYYICKHLLELKNRGVDVRMLFTHVTAAGDTLREFLHKEGIPYKFVRTGFISIVIADSERCKITLKHDDLKERVNLMIDNADLAAAMQQYFLTLWKKGTKKY